MPEALVEIGWAMVALFGVGALLIIRKLALSATGSTGLTLDEDGFTVRTLKLNERHRWQDVGDFDSLAVSRFIRRRYQMVPLSKSCVIFNDYRAPESPIEWLRVTGRNRALREAYEYSAEDLAKALSTWRKEALEKSLRSK
jgi:hypothetical protein